MNICSVASLASCIGDFDRDSIRLGLAKYSSMNQLQNTRQQVGKIVGAEYMFLILEYILAGKNVFSKGYNPLRNRIPYQYRYHLDNMDARDLELFFRIAGVIMRKTQFLSLQSRKELFSLRSEVASRLENFE